MRQLPAIDSRSWKQKRGISAPAVSHACSSVYSGGTSISLPSTMSLVMSMPLQPQKQPDGEDDARRDVEPHQARERAPKPIGEHHGSLLSCPASCRVLRLPGGQELGHLDAVDGHAVEPAVDDRGSG